MFASAVSGPSWFVTGGHTLSGGLSSAVHRYDFDYNIWVDVSVDGSPQQVASASAVFPDAAAGKMYLYGARLRTPTRATSSNSVCNNAAFASL